MMPRILLAAALLGFLNTAGAIRVLEQVEQPYELAVNQLTLPSDANGTLTLRACGDCRISTPRLDDKTTYFVNRQPLGYVDFLRTFNAVKISSVADATVANVFVDAESGRVTRITLWSAQPLPVPR